jgi:DNA gyrase/topoisomerase IV subunit B
MININLNDYKLVQPSRIKRKKGIKKMYDIEIKDDHTFFIKNNSIELLSHNCDGSHILSLIINFFYKWFPYIIKEGRLFSLITPLVVGTHNNKRKYFYSLADFNKFSDSQKLSSINYLKGLGSLDIKDWEFVMNNRILMNIQEDKMSEHYLEIAFGDSADKRKKWLQTN